MDPSLVGSPLKHVTGDPTSLLHTGPGIHRFNLPYFDPGHPPSNVIGHFIKACIRIVFAIWLIRPSKTEIRKLNTTMIYSFGRETEAPDNEGIGLTCP